MEFYLLCDINRGIKTALSNLQLVYYGLYHDLLKTILNTVKSNIYQIP